MCNKAVSKCFLPIIYIPDQYKTQEMCGKAIFEDPFMLVHCPDEYKTQRMCDEAVEDCLTALKFILICLLQLKKFKNFLLFYTQMIMYSI